LVDGTRSTDAPRLAPVGRFWSTPGARLAAVGALIVIASLFMPWYAVQLVLFKAISESALSAFGAATAALVLTTGAALYLITRAARGYRLPRPLSVGAVLALAGAWSAALVLVLIADRPDEILGLRRVELRFGVFVALAGAIALVAGGLRMRRN
jgi:hypothetical protein